MKDSSNEPRPGVTRPHHLHTLVDRLCDCLQVGLGLLGCGGRVQGAVEGGGQGLGDAQLGKRGPSVMKVGATERSPAGVGGPFECMSVIAGTPAVRAL